METNASKLLVIGGSAGALVMALKLVPLLKPEMNLSVIVVFHRKASEDNVLLDVLRSRTSFTIKEADDKDEVTSGMIYLAPADYHLLLEKDRSITLDDSEKINYSRPSIDATFESAAEAYGASLTCVLLSGANADGVSGLSIAKRHGARIVIQDPASAEVPYMPETALQYVSPDFLLSPDTLPDFVASLAN